MLFENGETKSDQATGVDSSSQSPSRSVHRTPVSSSRRRAWLWKNPLHNSFDDTDIAIADRHHVPGVIAPPSSTDNSRRESICSSQSSPNRSSPKRTRDKKKDRKDSIKESKDKRDQSPGNAAQRLYRVLEEQALGEAVGRLSGSGSSKNKQKEKEQQPINLCTPSDLSPNNQYQY